MATQATWTRSTWIDAGQLMALIDPDAGPGAAAGLALPAWYAQLVAAGELTTAVKFLAHALPRYECVSWAARALLETGALARGEPMMVAVLRWIDNPVDDLRRAAHAVGEAERKLGAGKFLCQAVFLSGGSLTPPELPPVQPVPDICAKLAAGAVIFGAHDRPDPRAAMRQALDLGEGLAAGR